MYFPCQYVVSLFSCTEFYSHIYSYVASCRFIYCTLKKATQEQILFVATRWRAIQLYDSSVSFRLITIAVI